MRFYLILVLPVAVVTGPLSSMEREMNPGQDLIPIHLEPEQSGGIKEKESPAQEAVSCLEEQTHHHDAQQSFLLTLRDAWSKGTELRKEDLAQFGICSQFVGAEHGLSWLLAQDEMEHKKRNHPRVLHTTKDQWDINDEGEFTLTLHFSRPGLSDKSTPMTSVLIIFFADCNNPKELSVKFSSHTLHPNEQTACVSEGTQFLVLTGGQAERFRHGHLKLKMAVETLNDTEQRIGLPELQAIMMRKDNSSRIALKPAVIFFVHTTHSDEDPHSNGPAQIAPGERSRTFFFLCELQKFLNEVLPQRDPAALNAGVAHDILHSLPPLSLGASSSDSLLLELVNSSAPTVFSFPQENSRLKSHHVKLALSPSLLATLRQRLDEALVQVQREEAGWTVTDKLKILSDLTTLPDDQDESETGLGNPSEVQYRALLLLKALQTVLGAWAAERAQRAARAGAPTKPTQCRLQSLTVSLEKYVLDPPSANINNCEGVCGFPLNNGNNHAILLNSHLQSGQSLNRPLCCVPIKYDDLCVIQLDNEGTIISYKTNMVAKECGCR